MLQQTHVRAVPNVYLEFIRYFPDAELLAEADVRDLKTYFLALGLSYRAERLKKCALLICKDYGGSVPSSRDELLLLPGVGEYISDAVLCYGYGKPTVPIDTNVVRLFCRYFGLKSTKTRARTDRLLGDQIRSLFINLSTTREANLAVLDFASALCTAKKPQCHNCPLSTECVNFKNMITSC